MLDRWNVINDDGMFLLLTKQQLKGGFINDGILGFSYSYSMFRYQLQVQNSILRSQAHRGRKDEKIYNNQTPIEQNRRGETAFWPFKVLKIDPDFENGRKIPYGVVVVGYIFERADTEHGLKEYRIRPIGQCREINNGQVSPR